MINEYEIKTRTKLNQVSPNTDFYWNDSAGFGGCVICQNEDGTTTFENRGDSNRYSERTESGEIEVYELVKLSTSLDEAINLCEASINEAKRCYQTILDNGFGERFAEVHQRNLSEYIILLGWLKELKAYRDDRDDRDDYKTLKIKLENAEDIIRGLQQELRDAREELRWREE